MRDRLQRRKKKPEEASDQPAPPPLQPAYFEAEQEPGPAPEAKDSEPESSELAPLPDSVTPANSNIQSEERPFEAQPRSPQQPSRGLSQPGRGRRRRGGRGRGGRGREQAVAQAFAPAAVKGSIPGVPVDAGEEFSEAPEAEAQAQESQVQEQRQQRQSPAAPRMAPPRVSAAQVAPKGVVVLAIGLPGSGKSSWFKRHNVVPLSSDLVRSLLFDDVREQRFQDLVFSNLRSMLKARLIARRPMNYVDATNLTPQERQHWIKLAKDYQYEVHAVFFDVPLEVCIERHERRDRVVPEDVMRRMAAKLKPPAFEEGFAKITVVRVKKKETAEA